MSFSVEFLGCKISQTDVQGVRERLLAGGLAEAREGGAVHVVNTCCVTNEAVAKSRKAVRSALRRGARARLRDGLRDAPRRRDAFARSRRARDGRARDRRGGGRADRPRARSHGLRGPGAAARAHAGVRQGAGRLHVRLRVLRDPARARREPLARAARRARRGAPAHRAGPSRARGHRRQPRPLPRRGDAREAARRPARARRAGRHRARPALVDRGQPPQRAAVRGAGAPARLPAPARAAAVRRRRRAGGHAAPLRRSPPTRAASSAPARRVPGLNLTGDVIVGFPAEDGAAFARTLAFVEEHRLHAAARVPVLAAPGHAHGRRRPGARRRSSAAGPSGCARSPTASAARIARRASAAADAVLVERVDADGRLGGYGADYTPYELRAHAGTGVGDLVEVVLEAPGERAALGRVL